MTLLGPVCTKARFSWKWRHRENMLKCSHFQKYFEPKLPGCKSEKDEYFGLRYTGN